MQQYNIKGKLHLEVMVSRNITVIKNGKKTELCLDHNNVRCCEADTKQEN
jgi:hypothetical protein